jgi:hypothetical protein
MDVRRALGFATAAGLVFAAAWFGLASFHVPVSSFFFYEAVPHRTVPGPADVPQPPTTSCAPAIRSVWDTKPTVTHPVPGQGVIASPGFTSGWCRPTARHRLLLAAALLMSAFAITEICRWRPHTGGAGELQPRVSPSG